MQNTDNNNNNNNHDKDKNIFSNNINNYLHNTRRITITITSIIT